MLGVTVQGGTGAGRKRPLKPVHQPWQCACVEGRTTHYYRQNPGYLSRCPDCRKERSDASHS